MAKIHHSHIQSMPNNEITIRATNLADDKKDVIKLKPMKASRKTSRGSTILDGSMASQPLVTTLAQPHRQHLYLSGTNFKDMLKSTKKKQSSRRSKNQSQLSQNYRTDEIVNMDNVVIQQPPTDIIINGGNTFEAVKMEFRPMTRADFLPKLNENTKVQSSNVNSM